MDLEVHEGTCELAQTILDFVITLYLEDFYEDFIRNVIQYVAELSSKLPVAILTLTIRDLEGVKYTHSKVKELRNVKSRLDNFICIASEHIKRSEALNQNVVDSKDESVDAAQGDHVYISPVSTYDDKTDNSGISAGSDCGFYENMINNPVNKGVDNLKRVEDVYGKLLRLSKLSSLIELTVSLGIPGTLPGLLVDRIRFLYLDLWFSKCQNESSANITLLLFN